MKRIIAGLALGAVALGLFSGCGAQSRGAAVSVEAVSMITGVNPAGVTGVYAGKVVSGETAEIKKDEDKTVLEVFVEEGDMVKAGDVLFSYDTEAMQLSLDKLYLEKESYENSISAAENEISELETEKAKASSDQQLGYTLQIDGRRADIREAEYNLALKEKEIETMEDSMDNTEIKSPLAGRIMNVGSADDSGDLYDGGDYGGDSSDAFITVMDVSAYRVEGRVNELNRGAVYEGMPVVIRSRMDKSQTWQGVIATIDWEKPVSGNNNMSMGGGGDEMTSSSKYPFYVVLDDPGDLLLGQHVYIEPDLGDDAPAGLMLPGWYIVDDSFVWAANTRGKLEKRPVELGAYDPDMDQYEILSGLDYTDYIAFPEDALAEGMDVVYYDESSFGGGEEELLPGGEDFFYAGEGDDEFFYDGGVYGEDVIPMEGAVG